MDARTTENAPVPEPTAPVAGRSLRAAARRCSRCRRSTGGAGRISSATGAATGRSGFSWSCSCVSLFAEFIANDKPFLVMYDGQRLFPGGRHLSGDDVRRRLRDRGGLSRSVPAEADRREGRLHGLAADPLLLRHAQSRSADAGAVAADLDAHRGAMQAGGREEGAHRLPRPRIQLARHRRSGPRRGGAADLRLPHLGAVRADPDDRLVGHRRRGRRGAGLFRRLDRPLVPALHRDLDLGAVALSAAHHLVGAGAGLLRAARHPAAVLLGVAGRPGARRIPARPQLRIHPGGARARRVERAPSCSGTCCRTPWWRR